MCIRDSVYTIGNQIVEVIRLHTDKNKADAWARAKELLELSLIHISAEPLRDAEPAADAGYGGYSAPEVRFCHL